MSILIQGNTMEYPFTSKMGHKVLSKTNERSNNKKSVPLYIVECQRCKKQYKWALYQANNNKTCKSCQAEVFSETQRLEVPKYVGQVLNGMRMRCYNSKNKSYHRYGGRGIGICHRWMNDNARANFHADMGLRPEGYSLDRIDNNGNYEPSNCRWATPYEQSMNRNDFQRKHIGCITKNKRGGTYLADTSLDGKRRVLGSFSTKEDAQRCIDEVVKVFMEYAFAEPLLKD